MLASQLHVVSVFSNNRQWQSRIRLLREYIPQMLQAGVTLTLVEHTIGERDFALNPDDPILRHVRLFQLRGDARHENWMKEGLVAYGVRMLPEDAKYIAVIDADVFFQRPDWPLATLDMLQVHRVGQPWSYSIDLGPDQNPVPNEWGSTVDRSFCAAWLAGDVNVPTPDYSGQMTYGWGLDPNRKKDTRAHCGYAWAYRLDVWNDIGGLPTWMVSGKADYVSAMAFAGKIPITQLQETGGGARRLKRYAELCDEFVKQDIGVVGGMLMHGFHGSKRKRYYLTREDILRESQFDPDIDLGVDRHGLPFIVSDNRKLRDGLRRLSTVRDEDANVV
ncbi:hypothetical protein [Acetobacter oeni]|uniref:Glycosyl transferase n=1 Tax=Acetobacter oeni TaxID=304077 RepID=A0A511XFT9_9PROT|nr:hypothetical protein [Acetobacter oeni]MBB3882249.1 hypothetical protein [Acetobacter oeni]NHO18004.1 hypothetical protein [Acetobacter oeni]GBR01215.1 hypothetical protein AA21952_0353 [Acetobacter oeni LMG 21952]GEN61833.1 hypothetical protein AOE01nite_00570 [Acetobacter oeni]